MEVESYSILQKLRNVFSDLNKIRELLQHDGYNHRFQDILTILNELLQKWPKEILEHVQKLEAEYFSLLNKRQQQLQSAESTNKRWSDEYEVINEMTKLQSNLQSTTYRLSNEHQKVANEITKPQSDVQEKTQRVHNQQESVTNPSQLSLVGIIHGHLPIDAEQGEKGKAKDKFSGFFRNSIEPLLDAMEECRVPEIESSAIACQLFQSAYNHCKEALVERMKDQLLQLFQRSEVISDEEKKRMDYTTMAFSLLCHGANVHQLKMKEDQTLFKKIRKDLEEYSMLQQKPTIQQEVDKLLTSAIETAQSLISCVPPMVVDCLPDPDFASKAYPIVQGDSTNYVTTQPALFFSYEAGGDKINGKCEQLPCKSCCFSRNQSDKEDGSQVFKKETATQTIERKPQWPICEINLRFPPKNQGQYSDVLSPQKIKKEIQEEQVRKRSQTFDKKRTLQSEVTVELTEFPRPSSPYRTKAYQTEV